MKRSQIDAFSHAEAFPLVRTLFNKILIQGPWGSPVAQKLLRTTHRFCKLWKRTQGGPETAVRVTSGSLQTNLNAKQLQQTSISHHKNRGGEVSLQTRGPWPEEVFPTLLSIVMLKKSPSGLTRLHGFDITNKSGYRWA